MVAVALVTAYNAQNELLLGRRKDNGRWTLPGGHLEDGEDPREGAIRELLEETGLTPKSLSFVTKYTTTEGVELNVYSATVTGEPHSQLDPDDEVDEWKFIDVSKGMPSKVDSKLHGPEDDTNILRQLYDLGKSELLKALPKTEKCAKCSKQATTRVLWAEGMAYQPACDEHIEAVKKPYVDKDEFCGLRPIKKADTRFKDDDVYKTFEFPDEDAAEAFSRRCKDHFEDAWKGTGVHYLDGLRAVVRAWDESNMDDFQHAAKKFGGKVIDSDELDHFVSPEYRRGLAKAEHEVARLLAHPNPVERLMALRLSSVAPDHVRSAMLDADPRVHEAAIALPSL